MSLFRSKKLLHWNKHLEKINTAAYGHKLEHKYGKPFKTVYGKQPPQQQFGNYENCGHSL